MERIKELIKILNEANLAYYQKDVQIMPDFEYDKLYDELKYLEASKGIVLANSPTQKVGYTVLSALAKVKHDTRMLSLDKTKDIDKLVAFLGGIHQDNNLTKQITGLLSWKLDGLTIVLRYVKNNLVQAVTRGNGEIGEDVTHNAKMFKNIPLRIKYDCDLTVRGEAIITFADFNKINDMLSNEDKYKNPRNLCSGTVRQLNNEIVSDRCVYFYAFSLVSDNEMEFDNLKSNKLKLLQELGFETAEYRTVNAQTVADAVEYYREKAPLNFFATDGLVLTYDSISYSKSLGVTTKFPKDSIAFKWADETAETTLLEIQWNTSRTGLINPVAIFEPVELEGTTVSKASLHNVSVIEGLKLGIGDRITVYKANMIIPQVAENLTKSNENVFETLPKVCFVCGFESEVIQVKEGKALYCTNPNCKAQLIRALTHFTSRDAMNIEGFSEATIEKFVEKGFLENYYDIFTLDKHVADILSMEGFGEKSFEKLIDAIKNSKNVQLPNFIYALGISQVGLSNAKLLCAHFDYKIDGIITAETEELLTIDGFGEVISKSVKKYFSNERNISLLKKTLKLLNIEKTIINSQKLAGKVFVITGDIHIFANRSELQGYIEALGGRVATSVSKKTTYLVNNDMHSKSSKNKKAKELNISVISENEFINMFGKG